MENLTYKIPIMRFQSGHLVCINNVVSCAQESGGDHSRYFKNKVDEVKCIKDFEQPWNIRIRGVPTYVYIV